MSSLNWGIGYLYAGSNSKTADDLYQYELWGLSSSERQWYHDPLAVISKQGKKWRLSVRGAEFGFEQVRGTYKTLKEAKAMGIAIVAMEGIKHGKD